MPFRKRWMLTNADRLSQVPDRGKMSVASLRTVCIKKTSEFLSSGVWDECEENPFSCMPNTVVQNLLSCIWHEGSTLSRANIDHARLLLMSGRLEHFVVWRAQNKGDYAVLLRILSRGCQSLRTLSVEGDDTIRKRRALHKLLQNCAKLEDLHSYVYFDPNDLRNCRNLKSLRLHSSCELTTGMFWRLISSDLLKRLGCVEVFANCQNASDLCKDEKLRLTRTILKHCPHLKSLLNFDSLPALKELHDTDLRTLGTARRLNLRRCYWNVENITYPYSQSECCDTIRAAALLCPLVEILLIEVWFGGVFQHLKVLRNLTSLIINFTASGYNYGKEFYSLLDTIGPQLRHLSVSGLGSEPLSLNVICGHCPNLTTLELFSNTTADEGVQPCANLLSLERLRVYGYDYKSLFFLLTSCLHLKVLCLALCRDLDDGVLQRILQENPLAELEVALIHKCFLSESGLIKFITRAPKLRSCCFGSLLLSDSDAMRCLKDLNSSVVCHSRDDFHQLKKEQFPLDKDSSCWM